MLQAEVFFPTQRQRHDSMSSTVKGDALTLPFTYTSSYMSPPDPPRMDMLWEESLGSYEWGN